MALISINNIGVSAIVSCVPSLIKDNLKDANLSSTQGKKIVDSTGIRYRRIAKGQTTGDFCFEAAKKIIEEKNVNKEEIEYLIFVSQTPDYQLPATSIILQDKLGLSQTTLAFDISLGCSGYVYGLSVLASLLEKSSFDDAKGLLLVGDVISPLCNKKDLSTYPLFGDAGTATLLKKEKGSHMDFDLNSNGN